MLEFLIFILCAVIVVLFVSMQKTKQCLKNLLLGIPPALKDALGSSSVAINLSADPLDELKILVDSMVRYHNQESRQVANEKDRLESVLFNLLDGVLLTDSFGRLTYMNDRLRSWLGVDFSYQQKRPLEVLRNLELESLIDKVCKGENDSIDTIFEATHPRHLQIYGAPLTNEGFVTGAVCVFHDVTPFKQLENLRKDFVANVSHELRTPISNIQGYAETLLDGALNDPSKSKKFVEVISQEALRMGCLVGNLLELAKVESGSLTLANVPCNLRLIIDYVVRSFEQSIASKRLNLITNIQDSLPEFSSDESMLIQIIGNLLDNAVKYTPESGQIKLFAWLDEGNLLVKVSDSGIGIPETDLPRIFERFYRVDKAHSRADAGTGLGLAIVKHLVQLLGGKIKVESTLGQGSTFMLSLPLQSDNQPL